MSAYANYEIHGKTSRGKAVMVELRAVATPTPEVAEWLLKERYPSATLTDITRPAARGYKREPAVVRAKDLSAHPVRRSA